MEKVKTLIIGSGPAGYTAAIYAGRAGLNPVLYSGMQPGGQLTITTEVENFPGYPNGVDGTQMMMDMKEQAARFGADLRDGSISKVDFSSRPYHLTDERGNEIEADTVIIATGASAKYLGLADEEKYRGQGVSACATCDGFFYRKRTVAVVGGGDTACEEAMYLSGLAKKVYMIVRKPYLRASEIMQKRVKEKENIEILFETNTLGLFGENGVEALIWFDTWVRPTRRSLILPSMVSSWLSAISLTQISSRISSIWMSRDSSRWFLVLRAPIFLASLLPAMLPTRSIVRALLQPALVPRLLSRQTDICSSCKITKCLGW